MVTEDLPPDIEAVQIIDFSAEKMKWKKGEKKKKKGLIQAEFIFWIYIFSFLFC